MPPDSHPTPKTLIVDLSKLYGGSTSRVLSLMSRADPGSIALAGLQDSAVVQHAQRLGLPVHIIGRRKTDLRILTRLIRLIRERNFQILDTQNIQSKFWGSLAASYTHTALVSTIHSWYTNEHGKNIKGRFYTALELLTNHSLNLYITVSDRDRRSLLQSGIPQEIIELIYNAVEIDASKLPGDSKWLRQKFDLPEQSIICTAVGRLVHVKGYDVLINAIQQISARFPQLVCLIVGEGERRDDLSTQIQQAGLQNQIRLVGFQDRQNTLRILKSSDIFVMPSRYEGTPIALLEAAALGLPIIASDTGGIPELVTHEQHAILTAPENSTALAQAIAKLYQDRQYALTLGENAQQRIQQSFSLDQQIKSTWNAYRKALTRNNARKQEQ